MMGKRIAGVILALLLIAVVAACIWLWLYKLQQVWAAELPRWLKLMML